MEKTKNLSILNDLLQVTNDRIRGFSKVEDKVWDIYPALRTDYDGMVMQSRRMKRELSQLISDSGGNPNESGSAAGYLHRTWIDILNSVDGKKAATTLGNVLYGEDAAINTYQKALEAENLCDESSRIIEDHLQQLRASYQKFTSIEDVAKKL